ncbi:MAG: TIGR04282 family arsenosugar biosynthesis glycosyltransferase [Acidobacteria bacterium]|nr:TIGR04282 family arsenosugar biosynthesis glycosyltransferase [Acidobacteriota bacterium]MBI3471360.1 TIGR04282 family arsenosugar biosynthesis glycosyltransferase [Candidatus Solibacter usitatus]
MPPVIILFAKAPVPGRVKTRLAESLGEEAAAELHEAFAADMLAKLDGLAGVSIELHTDIETDAWRDRRVARKLQSGGDLGERMLHALSGALDAGRPAAMIVGSDSPDLPALYLEELLTLPADVALGPSEDGGYYAIGCRHTHSRMFAGVPWSTSMTLAETERSASACGLSVARGSSWYDVDDLVTLLRLRQSSGIPPRTAAWFARHAGLLRDY